MECKSRTITIIILLQVKLGLKSCPLCPCSKSPTMIRLPLCSFEFHKIYPSFASHLGQWSIIHQLMLRPWVGGGQGDPGEFFYESQSQILHPGVLRKCQIPTPGFCFLPKTGLSYVKFPNPRAQPKCQNPHPGKSSQSQFPVGIFCESMPPDPP